MGFTSRPLGTGPSSLIQDEALRKKGVHVGDGVGPRGEGILRAGVGVWRGGGGEVGGTRPGSQEDPPWPPRARTREPVWLRG